MIELLAIYSTIGAACGCATYTLFKGDPDRKLYSLISAIMWPPATAMFVLWGVTILLSKINSE